MDIDIDTTQSNSSSQIKIKFNKHQFKINEKVLTSMADLKKELFALTNILPERQKLVFKGKVLISNQDLHEVTSSKTDNILTLIGSPETELVKLKEVNKKIVFVEDLTEEERVKLLKDKGEDVYFGLANLGNTCYFNSLVQCFGRVEPLRKALISLCSQGQIQNTSLESIFCYELGRVYSALDNATDRIIPSKLVQVMRSLNPLFNDQSGGYFKQQDADECMLMMLNTIKSQLKSTDDLFSIEFNVKLTNSEDPSEEKLSSDKSYKLVCFIDHSTTELVGGLKKSLLEDIDLYSERLNRNTVFMKNVSISKLPPYLNIQFMRFFWKKATEEMFGSKDKKTKTLKSVMFSKIIDVYELCSPDVQEVLKLGREIEARLLKEDKTYKTDLSCVRVGENMIPTGRYQLIAVCTHQGRSSDEGHYIGWTHKKDEKWVKYDDDVVSTQKTSDILELKGGGDWHMAYICIYQALEVPFMEM